MKKQTDLEAVKALAHAMLELDIEKTKLSPLVVKHPFTDNGISGVRKPDGSIAIADLLNKPDDLALWRKQVGSVIDKADSAFQIYMRICVPEAGMPGPNPGEGWPDAGVIGIEGNAFSLAWRCMDAQFWDVAQRRKRIFLLADFSGPSAPYILFDITKELEG